MTLEIKPDFDPNKPVQTKSGLEARIICTDKIDKEFTIVTLVTDSEGYEEVMTHKKNGCYYKDERESCLDLINIEQEKMTFDPTKPVQSRNGKKARIICSDLKGFKWNIVYAIEYQEGKEVTFVCDKKGYVLNNGAESESDLINIPENNQETSEIIAPFENVSREEFDRKYTPEAHADPLNERNADHIIITINGVDKKGNFTFGYKDNFKIIKKIDRNAVRDLFCKLVEESDKQGVKNANT